MYKTLLLLTTVITLIFNICICAVLDMTSLILLCIETFCFSGRLLKFKTLLLFAPLLQYYINKKKVFELDET